MGLSTQAKEGNAQQDDYKPDRGKARTNRHLASIKIAHEVADLLKVYCVFNNVRMVDFATRVLEQELQEFKKKFYLKRIPES